MLKKKGLLSNEVKPIVNHNMRSTLLTTRFLLHNTGFLTRHYVVQQTSRPCLKKGAEGLSTRKLLEVMDMFITLTVMLVLQVCAYAQTHQNVYIKYVLFFIYQLHLNKAVKIKKKQISGLWHMTTYPNTLPVSKS